MLSPCFRQRHSDCISETETILKKAINDDEDHESVCDARTRQSRVC